MKLCVNLSQFTAVVGCLAALCIGLAGCTGGSEPPVPNLEQLEAIREAAFRHQITPADPALPIKVQYLEVDGQDPSDRLLRRFADVLPPVRKVSQSSVSGTNVQPGAEGYWVRDKQSGQIGIIYRVGKIKWIASDTVTVEASYYCGGTFAAGGTLTLRHSGEKWEAVDSKNEWVS